MINGNTPLFLAVGDGADRAHLHALRVFTLPASIWRIVQIAENSPARANPTVTKVVVAVDFNSGEEGSDGPVIVVGAGNLTAMAAGTSGSLRNQHPFGGRY